MNRGLYSAAVVLKAGCVLDERRHRKKLFSGVGGDYVWL